MRHRGLLGVLLLVGCGGGGGAPDAAARDGAAIDAATPDAAMCVGASCCANGRPLPDPSTIDLRGFAQYVWPYVLAPTSAEPIALGCAANACHGHDARAANPSALLLRDPDLYCSTVGANDPVCVAADSTAQLMTADVVELMCWIDGTHPLASAVLTCPTGAACPSTHPSVPAWSDTRDGRYRALANFVLASRGVEGAHDDVFYRRLIVPELTVTQFPDGSGNSSGCSNQSCHVPGGTPAFDTPAGFDHAHLYADYFDPLESALHLFAADLSPLNPLAGGNAADLGDPTTPDGFGQARFGDTPHDQGGGGPILDVVNGFDGDPGQLRAYNLLLHFLVGAPDPVTGTVADWLIADRPFALAAITDLPPGPLPAQLAPVHFEDPGASADPSNVNGGQWLDLFAVMADGTTSPTVDLLAYFADPVSGGPVTTADGDTTYAFTYAYNATASPLSVRIAVTSAQPYRLFVDGNGVLAQVSGGDMTAQVSLAPGRNDVLLEIQREAGTWQFGVRMLDATGDSIDANGVRNVVTRLRAIDGLPFTP